MNTMTMPANQGGGEMFTQPKTRRTKLVPLVSIAAAHLVLFYLLHTGMLRQVVHAALPEVITVSFVAPPPPPPQAPAPQPKMVQLSQPVPTFVPPMPDIITPPVEPVLAAPRPQPAVVAPVAPVQAAAPAPTVVAAPAPPAGPRTVSDVEYIRPPQPVYPAVSRRIGESGIVVLRVLIGSRGQPEQVIVQKSSGSQNLDEAGRQAALRALFKPYMEDGKPVSVFVLVPVNFALS